MRLLDLFSGIGGFSLGLERAGFRTVAFCEIEPYPRAVLAKHWPGVPIYEDVRTLSADTLRRDGIAVDAICGGFPCQDLSFAGKRAGIEGERSGLWSEYARLIGEIRPNVAIVENVPGLLSAGHGRVLGDLAESGYDAEWCCIPAWAVGLPHNRERVWIVAYNSQKRGAWNGAEPLPWLKTLPWRENGRRAAEWAGRPNLSEAGLCRASDGISNRVDRLEALGNAVVPQIVETIGRAVMEGLNVA